MHLEDYQILGNLFCKNPLGLLLLRMRTINQKPTKEKMVAVNEKRLFRNSLQRIPSYQETR